MTVNTEVRLREAYAHRREEGVTILKVLGRQDGDPIEVKVGPEQEIELQVDETYRIELDLENNVIRVLN